MFFERLPLKSFANLAKFPPSLRPSPLSPLLAVCLSIVKQLKWPGRHEEEKAKEWRRYSFMAHSSSQLGRRLSQSYKTGDFSKNLPFPLPLVNRPSPATWSPTKKHCTTHVCKKRDSPLKNSGFWLLQLKDGQGHLSPLLILRLERTAEAKSKANPPPPPLSPPSISCAVIGPLPSEWPRERRLFLPY